MIKNEFRVPRYVAILSKKDNYLMLDKYDCTSALLFCDIPDKESLGKYLLDVTDLFNTYYLHVFAISLGFSSSDEIDLVHNVTYKDMGVTVKFNFNVSDDYLFTVSNDD